MCNGVTSFSTVKVKKTRETLEKCLDPNHLHDALKPPVAKRLCANDFFGEVKCLGGSTVLLKNFVCNVIAPDAPYPLVASESPRSEDTSPSMQKNAAFMCFNSYKASVQAINR